MARLPFTRKALSEQLSLGSMLSDLAGGGLSGQNADFNDGFGEYLGVSVDATRVNFPIGLLAQRDMTAAGASGSNYLTGTDMPTAYDALREWSGPLALGATRLENCRGNVSAAHITTPITGGWLSSESTQLGESQPTLGAVTLVPRTVGAYLECSRLLLLQSAHADGLLRRHLARTVALLLDKAIIHGSGASGEPQGILATANIGSVSGSTLARTGLLEAQRLVSVAGGELSGWIAAADVRKTLGLRESATGNGNFLWDADQVLGKPALVNGQLTAATLVGGQWDQLVVAFWGGVEITANPFAGFNAGIVGLRIMLTVDCAVLAPGAFVGITSVT